MELDVGKMKPPKPIKIKTGTSADLRIAIVGTNWKDATSYLSFRDYLSEGNWKPYGYIEDRDIKRLMKWCQLCLKGRKR